MQSICGEEFFRWEPPCNRSELVHFRHRIGEKGMERILAATVELHREEIDQEDEIVADTTIELPKPIPRNLSSWERASERRRVG